LFLPPLTDTVTFHRATKRASIDPKYYRSTIDKKNGTDAVNTVIEYSGNDVVTMYSARPLATDAISEWTIDITKMNERAWLVCGLIGDISNQLTASLESNASSTAPLGNTKDTPITTFAHDTCYGWGSDEYRISAGKVHQSVDIGWRGWRHGDRGCFTYNPFTRKLSLRHRHALVTSLGKSKHAPKQTKLVYTALEMDVGELLGGVYLFVNTNKPCNLTFTSGTIEETVGDDIKEVVAAPAATSVTQAGSAGSSS
jgi:hypothetical protein